ncbi:hypothetical protein [Erwinia typographi]|uniref:hypothetical protein n=1 Tax=Erwinia typographi TaxID=371042 RepID=UPI0012ECDAA3|nr:hypothetical protein [Erwinia typographi]
MSDSRLSFPVLGGMPGGYLRLKSQITAITAENWQLNPAISSVFRLSPSRNNDSYQEPLTGKSSSNF